MNRWIREYSDDRSGNWVTKAAPIGAVSVGKNPWMSPDRSKPYTVTWIVGPYGDDVRIGYASSEAAGKRIATNYLQRVSALFRGCV